MKEQPAFYAFFIRKMVAPTGDPKEIVVEGEWLHALDYLRRLDKKNVIGDKWKGHNVWFFTKQRQNLEADAVVSVVSAVPVRVNADGVLEYREFMPMVVSLIAAAKARAAADVASIWHVTIAQPPQPSSGGTRGRGAGARRGTRRPAPQPLLVGRIPERFAGSRDAVGHPRGGDVDRLEPEPRQGRAVQPGLHAQD